MLETNHNDKILSSHSRYSYTWKIVKTSSGIEVLLTHNGNLLYKIVPRTSIELDKAIAKIDRIEHCDKTNSDLLQISVYNSNPLYTMVIYLYITYMEEVEIYGFVESTLLHKGLFNSIVSVYDAPDGSVKWKK